MTRLHTVRGVTAMWLDDHGERALAAVGAVSTIRGVSALVATLGSRVLPLALALLMLGVSGVQGLMLRRPMRRTASRPQSAGVAPPAAVGCSPRAAAGPIFRPGRVAIPTTTREPAHV